MWAGLTYSQVGKIKTEGGFSAGCGKNCVRTQVFGHLHPHMPLCTSTIVKNFMHLKLRMIICVI